MVRDFAPLRGGTSVAVWYLTMGTVHARVATTAGEPAEAVQFYRDALGRLRDAGIPFMVGGGYAFRHFTGIERYTKDLDIFVRPRDTRAIMRTLGAAGFDTRMVFPHWLAKVYGSDAFIDVIFSSGNGVAVVDDAWFTHAVRGDVVGLSVPLCPAEETIWSKAFVAERERYDGADIAHIIRARGDRLDWSRLIRRFGEHWRVLLSHLVLFGYIYPGERDRVPSWVLSALMRRLSGELGGRSEQDGRLCRGTLLSREQYLPDLQANGYRDARLDATVQMTPTDIALWTRAIADDEAAHDEADPEHRGDR
jgi:hypothetical protein